MTADPSLPSSSHPEDPIDLIARRVPRHIGLSLTVVIATVLAGLLLFEPPAPVDSSELGSTTIEGKVLAILSEERPVIEGRETLLQEIRVRITRGERRDEELTLTHGELETVSQENAVRPGDTVLLESAEGPEGERLFISDYVRWPSLLVLALLFGVAVTVVGGGVGVRALIAMGFSVMILASFIVRGIVSGANPLVVSIIGSFALLTATLYLTYGWRPKTHAALAGLALSLLVTAGLSVAFVGWSHLTGFGTEEASFLQFTTGLRLDMRGVLLGGIIIGTLGVLDDVATNQASVIFELSAAAPDLGWRELFGRAMRVGRDHIAAVVNTLLLAYTGASLPLLLLLVAEGAALGQTLNRAFVAEEIVRTLVGSLGLVLATPFTTLIAALMAQRGAEPRGEAVAQPPAQ